MSLSVNTEFVCILEILLELSLSVLILDINVFDTVHCAVAIFKIFHCQTNKGNILICLFRQFM